MNNISTKNGSSYFKSYITHSECEAMYLIDMGAIFYLLNHSNVIIIYLLYVVSSTRLFIYIFIHTHHLEKLNLCKFLMFY